MSPEQSSASEPEAQGRRSSAEARREYQREYY